jgi:auxin influx carrier (AUX1 LAX family)
MKMFEKLLDLHALIDVEQWFEVLDGLLGKHWRNVGLFFNCTFLLFGSVIQLIACAR